MKGRQTKDPDRSPKKVRAWGLVERFVSWIATAKCPECGDGASTQLPRMTPWFIVQKWDNGVVNFRRIYNEGAYKKPNIQGR
ncbi:MAG: hypothetical protein DRP02_11815 [Candidatus Gerdarchaeota archaeon]|nr:MAG: hypothetical protein DRP02_11815 [Candidatus Gerdarchaeota archaeon]